MSHYLGYSITPVPYPILASPEHGTPNQIDLQVMVSGPPPDSGKSGLKRATIAFPVSDHKPGGQYLSDTGLPPPVYDEKGPWTVTVKGGTVTIKPKSPSAEFDSLLFELKGIPVDSKKGVVQVGVEERWGGESPVSDLGAVELVKLANDFPVAAFRAEPPTLQDIDSVMLKWDTAEAKAHQLGFKIEPSTLAPGAYDAADGKNGVKTAEFAEDTAITLVIEESGEEIASLRLSVPVEIPHVSPLSHVEGFGATNRLVAMRWWTENVTTCTLAVDGKVIDEKAPPETYHQPYPLSFGGVAGTHHLKLEAYGEGEPGSSHRPSVSFSGDVTTSDPVTVVIGESVEVRGGPFACTPDGKTLVMSGWELTGGREVPMLTLRDAKTGVLRESLFADEVPMRCRVQLTAEGTTGIAFYSPVVTWFDLSAKKATRLYEGESASDFAITPDGQALLILGDGNLSAAPVASPSKVTTLAQGRFGQSNVAFSHDGKRAFVAGSPNLVVVDLSTMSVEHEVELAVTKANHAFASAVSPDGAVLLLIAEGGRGVATWRTIDLNSLKEVGGNTSSVMSTSAPPIFFPQGMLALVVPTSPWWLVVLDLYREKETWFKYPPASVEGMAFVPNGGPLAIRSVGPFILPPVSKKDCLTLL